MFALYDLNATALSLIAAGGKKEASWLILPAIQAVLAIWLDIYLQTASRSINFHDGTLSMADQG